MIQTIAVAGAGTMGSGIAFVAAHAGFHTILYDHDPNQLESSKDSIRKNILYLENKLKLTPAEGESLFNRVQFISDASQCIADLVIEAIVEKVEAKVILFNQLASCNSPQVIFATNTSSLPVTAIQTGIIHPERVIGMHFFNPAPVMKLVEIIRGKQTSEAVIQRTVDICKSMNKVPVICLDSPGFIVNRVARQYYLESMRIVESGMATIENVDAIMEASGFKMGPFTLMDLIGLDVNLAVSTSLYDAFDHAERFAPSPMQKDKVNKGELGRKTGRGYYTYPT